MKRFLKLILLISFAISLQNQFWQNLHFSQGVWTIVKVAIIISIFEILLKPIIKVLLIPINILTLGTFRIVINTVGFYLAVFLLSDFKVNNINLPPNVWQGFSIPELSFYGFWAYVVTSASTHFLLYFFQYIIKPKKDKK